jgi:hypothetical protein
MFKVIIADGFMTPRRDAVSSGYAEKKPSAERQFMTIVL